MVRFKWHMTYDILASVGPATVWPPNVGDQLQELGFVLGYRLGSCFFIPQSVDQQNPTYNWGTLLPQFWSSYGQHRLSLHTLL